MCVCVHAGCVYIARNSIEQSDISFKVGSEQLMELSNVSKQLSAQLAKADGLLAGQPDPANPWLWSLNIMLVVLMILIAFIVPNLLLEQFSEPV